MSEQDLFAEVDAAAAAMAAPDRDDLQIEFRAILLARGEATDQWLALFDRWFERHLVNLRNAHAEAAARINAFIEAAAGTLPPGDPYRCPCGEVIYNWSPEMERLHAEHIYSAGLDRSTVNKPRS
jgi:hypothetical protein